MFLAEKTVKNYVSNLLAKLGMERRTQAAVFGARIQQRRVRAPVEPGGFGPFAPSERAPRIRTMGTCRSTRVSPD